MAEYKKPPPPVYNCEEFEEGTNDFEICTIKKQLQDGEITEDEARTLLEPLEGTTRRLRSLQQDPNSKFQRREEEQDPYTALWDNKTADLPEDFNTDQVIDDINFDELCSYNPKKKGLG